MAYTATGSYIRASSPWLAYLTGPFYTLLQPVHSKCGSLIYSTILFQARHLYISTMVTRSIVSTLKDIKDIIISPTRRRPFSPAFPISSQKSAASARSAFTKVACSRPSTPAATSRSSRLPWEDTSSQKWLIEKCRGRALQLPQQSPRRHARGRPDAGAVRHAPLPESRGTGVPGCSRSPPRAGSAPVFLGDSGWSPLLCGEAELVGATASDARAGACDAACFIVPRRVSRSAKYTFFDQRSMQHSVSRHETRALIRNFNTAFHFISSIYRCARMSIIAHQAAAFNFHLRCTSCAT